MSKVIELDTERRNFYGVKIKQIKFIALYTNEGTQRLNRFSKLIRGRDRIHFTPPNLGVLSLSTIDILSWIIVVGSCLVCCRMFSSIIGLDPLDAPSCNKQNFSRC